MKLLTITIPTYKRPNALLTCLRSILFELPAASVQKLAFIISDNDPQSTVQQLLAESSLPQYLDLTYVRNDENIGADRNIFQCTTMAKDSKYIWVLGDDDFPLPGVVANLLEGLEQSQPDCVFIECRPPYWGALLRKKPFLLKDRDLFLSYTNYHTTFLSAFIWRLADVKAQRSTAETLFGTSFVQLSWILPAIGKASTFLVMPRSSLTGGNEATGGYAFGQVFVRNFWSLWAEFTHAFPVPFSSYPTKLCRHLMLLIFYPAILQALKQKSGKYKFSDENTWPILTGEFGREPLFWATVAPAFYLPGSLLKLYRIVLLAIALTLIAGVSWRVRLSARELPLGSRQKALT